MQSGCKDYKPDGIGRRVWIAITELSPKAEQCFDHARIPALNRCRCVSESVSFLPP